MAVGDAGKGKENIGQGQSRLSCSNCGAGVGWNIWSTICTLNSKCGDEPWRRPTDRHMCPFRAGPASGSTTVQRGCRITGQRDWIPTFPPVLVVIGDTEVRDRLLLPHQLWVNFERLREARMKGSGKAEFWEGW